MPVKADLGAQLLLLAHVVWAMALGAIVGAERERSDKPAGLRTHMLVAGAAALVTGVSLSLMSAGGQGDPSRGLHAVMTGIGFLGAGAILRPKGDHAPTGLTTAATVFYTAALGVGVAAGYGLSVTVAALLAVAVLRVGWRMRELL